MSRLLLDSCVWPRAADELRAAGHDVEAVHDWSRDPGDEEILTRAREESDLSSAAVIFRGQVPERRS
ncbi:MAG: DUF5615 family PIN-like protein [Phycisphaerae bacterium]|nr:DUF5615 family PIN-like protein [Phycisphaerae bacterium]